MQVKDETETATIIDGKRIAADVRSETAEHVAAWTSAGNRAPFLSVVLIGDDPASASYVRGKSRACAEVGIHSETLTLPDSVSEDELLAVVDRLNNDDSVDGILVQFRTASLGSGPSEMPFVERRVLEAAFGRIHLVDLRAAEVLDFVRELNNGLAN